MGMFDYVTVSRPEFICSEGHDLSDEEFQTKDFDEVLGYVHVGDDLSTSPGCMGVAPELGTFQSYFETGCTCRACPAFVQAGTFNLCPVSVEFRVHYKGSEILKIERVSEPTAEFIVNEPGRRHMRDCRGPMPYEDAAKRHRDRSFFPWDPMPTVSEEQRAAQVAWEAELEAMRARWKR